MKPEFQVGLSAELTEETTESHAAPHLGSGGTSFYSTPAMIALMERTSIQALQPYLQEGESSVGVKVNVSHIAATPIGQKVRCQVTVEAIHGRRITFAIEAYNEKEKIGEGTHERVLISVQRFASKT